MRLAANPAELRVLAAQQRNSRIAKRLRVITLLAEGIGTLDAAAREQVNETTVRKWRAAYTKGGLDALMRLPTGRRAWLNAEQSAALAAIIRARPEISYAELCLVVKDRFGIAYREDSLAAYISRELGFMRHAGRFWGGGARP